MELDTVSLLKRHRFCVWSAQLAFAMRFEPVMQCLGGQTQNRCGCRNAMAYTNQSDRLQLELQRVPRPVRLSHNTSNEEDYASRDGIHFPGLSSLSAPQIREITISELFSNFGISPKNALQPPSP